LQISAVADLALINDIVEEEDEKSTGWRGGLYAWNLARFHTGSSDLLFTCFYEYSLRAAQLPHTGILAFAPLGQPTIPRYARPTNCNYC